MQPWHFQFEIYGRNREMQGMLKGSSANGFRMLNTDRYKSGIRWKLPEPDDLRFSASSNEETELRRNFTWASSISTGTERSKPERSVTESTPVARIIISSVSGIAFLGSFCNPAMTTAAMAMLHTASYPRQQSRSITQYQTSSYFAFICIQTDFHFTKSARSTRGWHGSRS